MLVNPSPYSFSLSLSLSVSLWLCLCLWLSPSGSGSGSPSLSPFFQCPDRFLRGLEAGIVNCQISCPALIPLSKSLSNIKSCEIGGRFLIILITAFLSLLKRARRNRFRSGNYACGPVLGSRSALERAPVTDGRHRGGLLPGGGPRTGDASREEMKLSHPRLGIRFLNAHQNQLQINLLLLRPP